MGSPHPPDIQICDPALGNIASETRRPFHCGEDTENMTAGGIQHDKYELNESLSSKITGKNPVTAGNTALTTHLEERKSGDVLGKYYFTDSDLSDEEPLVFETAINESVIPGVVLGGPFELENRNFFHTQNLDPEIPKTQRRKKGECVTLKPATGK